MHDLLISTAAAQHGLVTRGQALRLLSRDQLKRWLANGHLVRVQPSVYAIGGLPDSWQRQLHAVVLSANAVASHRSAARLYGLPVPAVRLEVTTPIGRHVRLPGVVAHRSNLLIRRFVTAIDGISTTTAARTVVDLSAVAGFVTCGRAMDAADRSGVAMYLDVDDVYRRMRKRGRRRVTVVEQLLAKRLDGIESGDSDWEMRLCRWLIDAGLPRPEQQVWVVAGGERFCLDLAYPDLKVGLEYDGWDVHRQRGRFDADRRKWRKLELAGWVILPYTSTCTELEVVSEVRLALARTAAA
jgi:predicted transcriptional regulator of viral defense system